MSLVGQLAPDFTLLDDEGHQRSLAEFKGQMVLLYFYPKDNTPGCVNQAQCLRNRMNDLKGVGVQVLGVSADSVKSHKKFKESHRLNFPLLADVDKKVIHQYGVWREKMFMGRKYMGIGRDSFLIGADGVVIKKYVQVKPKEHAEEVLADLKTQF